MTLHARYEPDNIFAKMLRGEMPAVTAFEDDVAMAFMDIFPQSRGHTLVIPKGVEARNLLDMPDHSLGPYMERVQGIAKAVERAFAPDGLIVTQFNGAPAGQTVFHLHFHLIPVYQGASPRRGHGEGEMADMDALKGLAEEIRMALKAGAL